MWGLPSACPPACSLPRSGGQLHEYSGDRSARHLKDWALGLLPKHIRTVSKKAQLEDLLKQCSPGAGSGSKWGVCALLLSDKADTSALYKSLALRWVGAGWRVLVGAGGRAGACVGGQCFLPRVCGLVCVPCPAFSSLLLPATHPRATRPCRYHGKVVFGEALRSNAEVSAVFGVTEYPTLLVVCGGNKDVVIKFGGGC